MNWRLARAAALMLATSFGAIGHTQEALVANPPLPTTVLTLTSRGHPHHYTVEVAKTPVEQARGLMLRRSMSRNHGMLFPFEPAREASFWMEGTYLPLDIVFIAPDHSVLSIAPNAVPFSRTNILSNGTAAAVLELNAGEAARVDLHPGDTVLYSLD